MKQVLKSLLMLFAAAMCLTSDTTSSSTAQDSTSLKEMSIRLSSASSVGFVATIPMPKYLAFRRSTLRQRTRPSG